MMAKKCFEPGCMNEVGYACKCSSPETLLCGAHIEEHVNFPNRAHNLESIFIQPCEGTKEAILEFLTKENLKYNELRRKIIDFFSQRLPNSEKDLGDLTSKLDCYSDEINDFFAKISQASKLLKSEEDPILGLLSLQPQEAIEKVKLLIIATRDWYNGAKLFCIFSQKLESLNKSFFAGICGAYLEKRNTENKTSKPTNIESANVKNSISLIINENSESLKGPENINKPITQSPKNETILLNSQINTASNDLSNKPKKTEKALNAIDTLRNKAAEILGRLSYPELEIDFRTTCSAIQANSSFYDPLLIKAYQDYINAYQQKTSLYNIKRGHENGRTNLIIYNTETETQEVKILQTPEPLDWGTCITQLPNGKLFCFGKHKPSGITELIDVNSKFEKLPSGTPCGYSSIIYFNSSVYCFGGYNNGNLTLSSRFDLDRNRWIQLTSMPKADRDCNSIIFNRNILISGYRNKNLLLYSIDIDSFSTIPYEFGKRKIKILINAKRIYLIECSGSIYESEIGSYSNWERIGNSIIDYDRFQVNFSCNKGGIYISTISDFRDYYFFFNLDQKSIVDVAYYNEHISLRRVGKKIEAIKCNNLNFKLDPYYLYECNVNDITLNILGKNLEEIERKDEAIKLNQNDADLYHNKGYILCYLKRYPEAIQCYDEAIKHNPNNDNFYNSKGNAFYSLERYLEAIECYNEAIKLNPNSVIFHNNKGRAFYYLTKYPEAIECYEEAIKRNPNDADLYNNKGNAFKKLERYIEAIECYDKANELNPNYATYYNNKGNTFKKLEAIECYGEAIKRNPNNADFYYKKGSALNDLGRYPEAVESYDEAIKINPNNAKYYNDKGNTLCALERYQEAMQCYDEAIKLEPNNPLHFCSRARVFNNLRQEEAALQNFNRAYNLKQENLVSGAFTRDEWSLSEKDINFINDVLGRDRIELLQKMQI